MAKKTAKHKTAESTARREPIAARNKATRRRPKAHKPRDPERLPELQKREEPPEVTIDEYIKFIAASYDFDGDHDFNDKMQHPQRKFNFGGDALRRWEKRGAESKAFGKLTYLRNKAWLVTRLERLSTRIRAQDLGQELGSGAWPCRNSCRALLCRAAAAVIDAGYQHDFNYRGRTATQGIHYGDRAEMLSDATLARE